jgi:hypothetical protein
LLYYGAVSQLVSPHKTKRAASLPHPHDSKTGKCSAIEAAYISLWISYGFVRSCGRNITWQIAHLKLR